MIMNEKQMSFEDVRAVIKRMRAELASCKKRIVIHRLVILSIKQIIYCDFLLHNAGINSFSNTVGSY